MNKTLPPFAVTYTPNIPEILFDLHCTLAFSTYQAGKVVFLSAINREKLIQLPRTFDNAMGIAISEGKMAIACKNELIVLKNSPAHAKNYPAKPNTYDSLFLPRCRYYTGHVNLHDMYFVDSRLIAVNTLFSCLSEINDEYSFQPIWQPAFISSLQPEDRCHLNGMAIKDGIIEYVTALGMTDAIGGWRENKMKGGVLIHVPTNEILLQGLSMPHSPRIYDDNLFFLDSAQGELRKADIKNATSEVVVKLGSFARGMTKCGDYLFIGVSKLRHTTSVFKDLPIAKSSYAGIVIVYLPYGNIAGQIKYETSVDEIYDVKMLHGLNRPGLLNPEKEESIMALATPTDTFWASYEEKK
jgi:uncharacterized protein (TIGR03032 family)